MASSDGCYPVAHRRATRAGRSGQRGGSERVRPAVRNGSGRAPVAGRQSAGTRRPDVVVGTPGPGSMRSLLFLTLVLVMVACDTGPTAPDPPLFRPTTPTTATPTRLTATDCNARESASGSEWGRFASAAEPTIYYQIEFEKRQHADCQDLDVYVRIIAVQNGATVARAERVAEPWYLARAGVERAGVCGTSAESCRMQLRSLDAYRLRWAWRACFSPCWPDWPQA